MNALKLYEIANQFQALEDLATDDLPVEVIRDTLEGLEGDFDAKAIEVAKFILSLEASADAAAIAADAMKARSQRVQRRADNIRAYLLFNLQAIDKKCIAYSDFIITRRNNPVAVQLAEIEKLPAEYWVQPDPPPPRPDKKAIKEALQAGRDVPGAYLESGERVEIKL
jgi:hypothetical protein